MLLPENAVADVAILFCLTEDSKVPTAATGYSSVVKKVVVVDGV